ncbi:MAG: hypothetical protein RLY77_1617, partial [Pseudomonadota bacterium]
MDISHYFKLMAEKDASDMFLSTGAPISIKIEGVLQPMSDAILTAGECKTIAYSLMDSAQISEFEREKELNMAISVPGSGRFRVNVFQQRGEVGMVIRTIRSIIPTIEDLQLPQV